MPVPTPSTVSTMTDTTHDEVTRSILRHLDVGKLRAPTRTESRSRERHLPPISTYRWWARRTETVSGAIVDAVAADRPGDRLLLADPFAGGGVIALAGLLRGHRMYAQDVNPWAARSLTTMLTLPPPADLEAARDRLHSSVKKLLDRAYATTLADGSAGTISQTLRVASGPCPGCATTIRLFPTAVVSLLTRVDCGGDVGYVACRAGHLNLATTRKRTTCGECHRYVQPRGRYTADRSVRCASCGWFGKIAALVGRNGFTWEIVLIERTANGVREIGPPTPAELAAAAPRRWKPASDLAVIEPGIETSVLLRHGMRHWHDLYPRRQRVVIEALLAGCDDAAQGDPCLAAGLRAAVIGATEMAGFASRWDARYLKSYETVANHRYNFTTLSAEPNMWGAPDYGRGTVDRRLDQLTKAAIWLEEKIGRDLHVEGPRPASDRRTAMATRADARIVAGGSQRLVVPKGALDAVITDPPYHDDVHYGELSDLFRAWADEATGVLEGDAIVQRQLQGDRTTDVYERTLTRIFKEVRRALREDGHMVLSYANRHAGAWVALINALTAAGFVTAGYTVVHSENESDHAKLGKRACTLDILVDLVPSTDRVVEQHRPSGRPTTDEERFCRLVGEQLLDIGHLGEGWSEPFTHTLNGSTFVRARKSPRDS